MRSFRLERARDPTRASEPRNVEIHRTNFRGDPRIVGLVLAAVFLSESGATAFEALKDLLARDRAGARSRGAPAAHRPAPRRELGERRARAHLAAGTGRTRAPTAGTRNVCLSREQCLHLAASAIRGRAGSPVHVDAQLKGAFRRIPIGAFKVGTVVSERRAGRRPRRRGRSAHRPARLDPRRADPELRRPAAPLPRAASSGVLGVFVRVRLDAVGASTSCASLASHAAAAIAERARVRRDRAPAARGSQRENEYLREVVTSHDDFTTIVGSSPAIYHVKRQIDLVAPTDATRARLRRVGDRQGARRRGHPPAQPALRRDVHPRQLRGHPARALRERVLRPRQGRLLRARCAIAWAASRRRTAARSSSTRSARSRSTCRASCCACCRKGAFERVGETRSRRADVRIVAATNRELTREVTQGRFRQDLFYRLNVFPIEMPALRERREDVALIAVHLVAEICRRMHREPLALGPDAARASSRRTTGPGTCASSRNVLERAVISTPHSAARLTLAADRRRGEPRARGGVAERAGEAAAPVRAAPRPSSRRPTCGASRRRTCSPLSRRREAASTGAAAPPICSA